MKAHDIYLAKIILDPNEQFYIPIMGNFPGMLGLVIFVK